MNHEGITPLWSRTVAGLMPAVPDQRILGWICLSDVKPPELWSGLFRIIGTIHFCFLSGLNRTVTPPGEQRLELDDLSRRFA